MICIEKGICFVVYSFIEYTFFFLLNIVQAGSAIGKYSIVPYPDEDKGEMYNTNIHFSYLKCIRETSRKLEESSLGVQGKLP